MCVDYLISLGMAGEKLSRAEIQLALDRIVKKYDEYINRFLKSPKLKGAFEERYFDAVRKGLDMASFLAAEVTVVEELLKNEAEHRQAKAVPAEAGEKKEAFADRIARELMAKVEKYPDVRVHKDGNPEIRHLVGALNQFDEQYIPMLQDGLKNTIYAFNSQTMMQLDSQLRNLCSRNPDTPPTALNRYLTLLNVFPRDYKVVDREEKAYLMESAFFLNDVFDIIRIVLEENRNLSSSEKEKLDEVRTFMRAVIEDFRLKDLKRSNF